jgi:hypothetical protein
MKIVKYVLWAIGGLLLLIVVFIGIWRWRNTAEAEVYLIPEGFTGKVNIVFNRNDGVPTKYEDGRRVYNIPSNGILLTQFKINDGFINREYYYVNKTNRIPLEIFKYEYKKDGTTSWEIKNDDEIGVFLDGTSGSYGSSSSLSHLEYQEFIVSNYKGLDSFYTKEYQENFMERLARLAKK